MAKRILLCLSHSIEEHDQLKLLTSLGYEVASIGGYINPHAPHDPKRPALPEVPHFPEVQEAIDALGVDDNLGAAQTRIPEAILEWLGSDGIIIFHHYLSQRLFPQWEHLREWREAGGRVIWRTVGQSIENNEREAAPFRADGLEIVRYSPNEVNIPGYAGEDALIRFYKDPDEWYGWTGDETFVGNVTQELLQRHPWTNAQYYLDATRGLRACPAGPGSEKLPGGQGALQYEDMKHYLREARVYLYTGTQPASYTLGFLEALMTGIPIISITPNWMTIFPYGSLLFEGSELAPLAEPTGDGAMMTLGALLDDHGLAQKISQHQRWRAIQTFGKDVVGKAWKEYLG